MIRCRPTMITPGQDDLFFHLESLRIKYAGPSPGPSGDRRSPREDDGSSDSDDTDDTFFGQPIHSPFSFWHCSSSEGDGESEPELPAYLRDGDGNNYRTADATRRHRAEKLTGLEDHCNKSKRNIVSASTVEQNDPHSSACRGIGDSAGDNAVVRRTITTQEIHSQDSEDVNSLTPTTWQITLNTAFDRLKGHPPHPSTYLYQRSPAPSDFTLPSVFSVENSLCDSNPCQQLAPTEIPRSTSDPPDTAIPLGQSTYRQPPLLPISNPDCFDQPMSKQPSAQTHSIVMPQWTPVNKDRSMNARSSPVDSNRNTAMDLPLSPGEESHMHGHLDKIISNLSPSSGFNYTHAVAGVNTMTNTHDTQCPVFTATIHEHQAMMSTEDNPGVSNIHPGMVAPHGRHSGSNQIRDDEFMASTLIKARYLQGQANLLAQELHGEPKENAEDYGLAVLRSRPLGQWYRISSAAGSS